MKISLSPLALATTPALIETLFPAQKVSFEAQRERKAGAGQTLTALGSYWKGRKPLILVRAIVLGSLLPRTDDPRGDLEMFEKLMAFDDEGLVRRALVQDKLKPKDIAARIELANPGHYFRSKEADLATGDGDDDALRFPLDADAEGITLRWQTGISEADKLSIYRKALATFDSYEAKAALCKRPEEVDQDWLYAPVWPEVNRYYGHLGIQADSHQALVEQLGILRFGHRPRVGDTFCGGGSIPFEAARLGCDVYASDLNPIACMLTWGALNIIGASPERRAEIEAAQQAVAEAVDREITELGIEHDEQGNRAKAYLYCLETRCPETGWMVPMAPSWVISKNRDVYARLIPDHERQRYDFEVIGGASKEEMREAAKGTVQSGRLVHPMNPNRQGVPVATIRGDFREDGTNRNRLRSWEQGNFKPVVGDIFQERLYCIHWMHYQDLSEGKTNPFAWFAAPTEADLQREALVEQVVTENLYSWQKQGFVPDMPIEPGDKTDEPIRTRGWTHWHQLFNPRQLLGLAKMREQIAKSQSPITEALEINLCMALDNCSKLCSWNPGHPGSGEYTAHVFYNQALNCFLNYSCRTIFHICRTLLSENRRSSEVSHGSWNVLTHAGNEVSTSSEIFITDPPYADAVNYHEITEYFIAWLRKNPPPEFANWTWDSRRALAIQGSGDDFRRRMVDAYTAMTRHMPDNGLQCVMFTHQDTGVWADMVGIFWASGLQVVAAWYIATETTSELKKGGYVQGTVILMLRKRPAGERPGFKQRILPAVRNEVKTQIEQMLSLNHEVTDRLGEPVFNDSDLQMAGYAAALKILTAYTQIGGEDVTTFALRPRRKGETTVVDEIVQQAAEAANNLLVPEGLASDTWQRLQGIERFYLRMLDMETTGAAKLDNYQNFAKAFRVADYTRIMGSMTANKARLKRIGELTPRDLSDSTELGASRLGRLIIGLQQLLADTEPQTVIRQIQEEMADFMEVRPLLIDLLDFLHTRLVESDGREIAEVFANRLRNLRALGQ